MAQFGERMDGGPIDAVVIHAIYLINCASKDTEIREKSATSLVHALRTGDRIGAAGVVLHPGSAEGRAALGGAAARGRDAQAGARRVRQACPLLLEDTAGAGDTLGRTFEELAELIDLAGRRTSAWASAWTPATCWPPASTSAPPTASPR